MDTKYRGMDPANQANLKMDAAALNWMGRATPGGVRSKFDCMDRCREHDLSRLGRLREIAGSRPRATPESRPSRFFVRVGDLEDQQCGVVQLYGGKAGARITFTA